MKTKTGKRITYIIVFLFLCMAITTVAVKAPALDDDKIENSKVENETDKEVRSNVIIEDDRKEEVVPQKESETVTEIKTPKMEFSKPVFGEIIVDYSMEKQIYSKTMNDYRTHCGVDIKANIDDDVYASESGIVSFAGKDDLMGETVKIRHPDDSVTVYSGLKSTSDIVEGQSVSKGEVIGKAGGEIPMETAEGTHIHFEIIKENVYINPFEYIK